MKKINAISLDVLPLDLSEEVGVLLYHEYPVTAIFSSSGNQPIVRHWLDCSDDNTVDRYFFFESSKENLKKFIDRDISHISFINSAESGIGFIVDEKDEEILSVQILSPDLLDRDYVPDGDVYFEIIDGVDTEKIINYFDLNSINYEEESIDSYFKELANYQKTELLNIHLLKGRSVGYGTVETKLLGEILEKFDTLYKEIAYDQVIGKDRGEVKKLAENKEGMVSTQVVTFKAASFSVFIKPIVSQYELLEGKTSSQLIAERIFNLLTISSDPQILQNNYTSYSNFVFKAYTDLLKDVISVKVNLNLNWFNPVNKIEFKQPLTTGFAIQSMDNIKNISTEESENIEFRGQFTAINVNTRHYTFKTMDDESFNGYFDAILQDGLAMLNFRDFYDITVNKITLKEANRTEPKISYNIIAYYEVE